MDKPEAVFTEDGLTDDERTMFGEIAEVLKKHSDHTRQFGMHLSHQHFEIAEDEVLHEVSVSAGRLSILRPIKRVDLPEDAFLTSWNFSAAGVQGGNWCCD